MQKAAIIIALIALILVGSGNRLPDTPYIFPYIKFFPKMPEAKANPVTVEGVNLGRHLFYDPVLSSDSMMSCASCHKQQFAFSDSSIEFSTGRNAALMKRNTMPLFNLAWYPALFWDGRASSIEEQVFHPLRSPDEMNIEPGIAVERLERSSFYKPLFTKAFGNGKIDTLQISRAIAQFMRTLISYQSKYDKVLSGEEMFTKDEFDGFVLVNDQTKGDCIHCHITDGDVLGTNLVFSNNGLDSIADPDDFFDKGRGAVTERAGDNGKFMVPSLRNLAFTAPYMHDGRFKTLEDVINFYSEGVRLNVNIDSKMGFAHQGGVNLTGDEKKKVIAFLLTLSDSAFVSDPEFSRPERHR